MFEVAALEKLEKMNHINVLVDQDSFFGNNTSFGPSSCLTVGENSPWMKMTINNSSFLNNWGYITNDIYAKTLDRFEFIDSKWGQLPPNNRMIEQTTKPDSRGKFIHINETEFEIRVENSVFDCQTPLDRDIIFTLNH